VLFRKADDGFAGGLVRFTAHPVVCSAVMSVSCAVRADFPASVQDAQKEITNLRQRLASLKQGQDSLKERKDLAERIAFYGNARGVLEGLPYLLPGEAAPKIG
jgi:hypothetical protein